MGCGPSALSVPGDHSPPPGNPLADSKAKVRTTPKKILSANGHAAAPHGNSPHSEAELSGTRSSQKDSEDVTLERSPSDVTHRPSSVEGPAPPGGHRLASPEGVQSPPATNGVPKATRGHAEGGTRLFRPPSGTHSLPFDGTNSPGTAELPARASRGNSGGQGRRDSALSDITLSDVSSMNSISQSRTSSLGNRGSNFMNLQRAGDLELDRQMGAQSVEEEFFIYDDIVILKNEARAKHWRVAGRKPAVMELPTPAAAANNNNPDKRTSTSSHKGNYFTFNDFDVVVDEVDMVPGDAKANGLAPAESAEETSLGLSSKSTLTGSMSITNTVCTVPNTVAYMQKKQRDNGPKADRPLKKFSYSTILGHPTRVKCIAIAPSERDYASCSNEDASITLSNFAINDEVGIFTGHTDTIISSAISPDGKYMATTSKDKTMILWDVVTTKQLLTYSHAKVVICCCFGPDSKYLVSGCQDRVCRLWDTRKGKEWISYTHHEGIIIAVAYSPDGGYVCSASADKTLRVWSATTGKTRYTLTGHAGIILSCSYTTDGKYIISNDEALLRVWSTENGTCTLSLAPKDVMGPPPAPLQGKKGPKQGWTLSCAAPGGFTKYLLIAGNNRYVYVVNRETGEVEAQVYCKASVYCLTAGTQELAAAGDHFGNVYLLRME